MSCAYCDEPDVATGPDRERLCVRHAALADLEHLRERGRLRAKFCASGQFIVSTLGYPLLRVLRSWRWAQNVGQSPNHATIWYVVAADEDRPGQLYQGRGAGPGRPITIHRKAIPKRIREKL